MTNILIETVINQPVCVYTFIGMSNYIWKKIRRENTCSTSPCQMTEYLYIKSYFTICIFTKHYTNDHWRVKWLGHVAWTGETSNVHKILVGTRERKRTDWRSIYRWDIKREHNEIVWKHVDYLNVCICLLKPNTQQQIHINGKDIIQRVLVKIYHPQQVHVPRLKPTTNGEIVFINFHNLQYDLQLI